MNQKSQDRFITTKSLRKFSPSWPVGQDLPSALSCSSVSSQQLVTELEHWILLRQSMGISMPARNRIGHDKSDGR